MTDKKKRIKELEKKIKEINEERVKYKNPFLYSLNLEQYRKELKELRK